MRHYSSNILLSLLFSVSLALSEPTLAANQVLNISENTRLEASIAKDAMNRLTVSNDRIVNVFGDEGSFMTQTDEQTGQVFIKPSPENGNKPLSLTLVTENGITQDLSLKPESEVATTIILKNRADKHIAQFSENDEIFLQHIQTNPSYQAQLIQIMKQAILDKLPSANQKHLTRVAPNGYKLSFVKSYQSGNFLVTVWSLKNVSKAKITPAELDEKRFFQPQDLALYLENRFPEPHQKTNLYVIQRI